MKDLALPLENKQITLKVFWKELSEKTKFTS